MLLSLWLYIGTEIHYYYLEVYIWVYMKKSYVVKSRHQKDTCHNVLKSDVLKI